VDAKELAEQIVEAIEVEGKERVTRLSAAVNIFIDGCLARGKGFVAQIETEEELEKVLKEVIALKITDDMIDDLIRLPIALEWTDDIAIKTARPMITNLVVAFLKKKIVVRFGGEDWFDKFKSAVAAI